MSNWYLHIQGETVGPMSQNAIEAMLKQNRLQFADFIWTEGLTKWARVFDLDEFAQLLPPYPKTPIPSRATKAQKEPTGEAPEELPEEPEEMPAPPERPKTVAPKKAQSTTPKPSAPQAERAVEPPSPPPKPPKAPKPVEWPKIRRFVRVPIDARVEVVDLGKFDADNISEGGVFLITTKDLELGLEVKFKLTADALGKPLDMTGIIIRAATENERGGFAIEFIRVNPAHRRLITEYVNRNSK